MSTLDKDYAAGLLDKCDPPCLSLYQPTHRHHPDNQQDPIRFRNLVKELEEPLRQQFPKDDIRTLLQPFLALANDRDFWNHTFSAVPMLTLGSRASNDCQMRFLDRPSSVLVV